MKDCMTTQKLRRTMFEAEPLHSETRYYGLDFIFEREQGDLSEDPGNFRCYAGSLRVGGLIAETEDIEGVRVRYSAIQIFPRVAEGSVSGEFVMQTITREALERRADMAVEKLQLQMVFAAVDAMVL